MRVLERIVESLGSPNENDLWLHKVDGKPQLDAHFGDKWEKVSGSGGVSPEKEAAWDAKYDKPATGIPASDLASGVIPSVPVTDVTVGGTSVLNNGTAVIPAIPTVPEISTDISTDASSDTKTASPKAVKTYVDQKFVLITDTDYAALVEAGTVDPNKIYMVYEAEEAL